MIWKRANLPTRHRQGGEEGGRVSGKAVLLQTCSDWTKYVLTDTFLHTNIPTTQSARNVWSCCLCAFPAGPTHRMSHFGLLRKSLCIIKMFPGNTPAVHIFYSMITRPCQILSQQKWWRGRILSAFGWKLVRSLPTRHYSLINQLGYKNPLSLLFC